MQIIKKINYLKIKEDSYLFEFSNFLFKGEKKKFFFFFYTKID